MGYRRILYSNEHANSQVTDIEDIATSDRDQCSVRGRRGQVSDRLSATIRWRPAPAWRIVHARPNRGVAHLTIP